MNRGRHARNRPHHRAMRRADLRTYCEGMKASPPARHVFMAVTLWANSEGRAWPSVGSLVAVTGLGQATVRRALSELVAQGDLLREKRPGHSDCYLIVIHSAHSEHTHPAQSERGGAQSERAPRSQRAPKVVSKTGTKKSAPTHTNGTAHPPAGGAVPFTDDRGTFLPGTGWIK